MVFVETRGKVEVSFIIPLFNHLAHSMAMLESLQATIPADLPHEIVLIDDCSTDGTRAWLDSLDSPHIRTVLNPQNLGYAKTNNRAVSIATGEVLALLNNDLLFEPGWLEPMLFTLLAHSLNAGLVGNVQFRMSDGKVDHAGVFLNQIAQFSHIQTLASDGPLHTKSLAVTGACMLLRKSDFDTQGGFEEKYVNGCEDIDLCFKLRAAGKFIYVANTSRIRHHVSLSRDVNTLNNDRNSLNLFGRWRKLIKQELAAQWAILLQTGPNAYAGLMSGQMAAMFRSTPHTAALVIAEAMLLREEYRWRRDLGEIDPNENVANSFITNGLVYKPYVQGYLMAQNCEFAFKTLRSARNFYVCGRTTIDLASQPVVITITLNSIQMQTITLSTGHSVNVGIVDPILLQGIVNSFRLTAHFVDVRGEHLGDANSAIVISHIVIDDQVISDF